MDTSLRGIYDEDVSSLGSSEVRGMEYNVENVTTAARPAKGAERFMMSIG